MLNISEHLLNTIGIFHCRPRPCVGGLLDIETATPTRIERRSVRANGFLRKRGEQTPHFPRARKEFRVPLNSHDERPVTHLNRFHQSIGTVCYGVEHRGNCTHSLMMHGIRSKAVGLQNAPELRFVHDFHEMACF